jgi:hypothetical protein
MPIRFAGTRAVLEGYCAVEEAHDLAEWLLAGRNRKVDMAACTGLHAAVLQGLMALRAEVIAAPADADLARWLAAALPIPPSSARGVAQARRRRAQSPAPRRSASKA